MIKFEKTKVMNFDGATRGMRNPLESWDKSDSFWCLGSSVSNEGIKYMLGENDLVLAERLATAGSDHGKFLRQIFICVDITAPLYWWKEFDTYKVGTVANSTSTMHKIHTKSFHNELFSVEDLVEEDYMVLKPFLDYLEKLRLEFNETKDKSIWRRLIQMNLDSFNQTRTVTLNYENLRNMYNSRHNHKLTEWHTLCDWIKTLPYANELILSERNKPKENPNIITISKEELEELQNTKLVYELLKRNI